jgi:hypothetical protein
MNFKPNMLFLNRSFDKKRLKALLLWFRLNLSENAALKAVEILQGLGFRSATQGAISLGLDDLKTPTSKGGRVFQAQVEVALAHHEHHRGNRTPVELFQHLVDTWHRTSQDLTTEVVQLFHSTERVNPVYMMAFSGARGNISQVRQLVGMRGLMADPRGQIVGFPILSNFREGLTITEYFVSCYGARKGVVDTAIRTADAGYLTRRLADVSHHVVVRTTNCGTHESILLRDIKEGQKTILSLANRLVGRVLAEHVFLPTSSVPDYVAFTSEATSISPPRNASSEAKQEATLISPLAKLNSVRRYASKEASKFSCASKNPPYRAKQKGVSLRYADTNALLAQRQRGEMNAASLLVKGSSKALRSVPALLLERGSKASTLQVVSRKKRLPLSSQLLTLSARRGLASQLRKPSAFTSDSKASESEAELLANAQVSFAYEKPEGYAKQEGSDCFAQEAEKQNSIPKSSRSAINFGEDKRKTLIYRNSEITSSLASKLAEHYLEVPVRSPLSCSLPWGVCQLCYGWGLSEGRRVTLGEAVGIIAAQSIGEPGTQLTLRTFHTGGVFSGELLNEIRAPYSGNVIFPTPLQGLLLRTPHGQIAFLTKVSGKMRISDSFENTETHFANKIENLDTLREAVKDSKSSLTSNVSTLHLLAELRNQRGGGSATDSSEASKFSDASKAAKESVTEKLVEQINDKKCEPRLFKGTKQDSEFLIHPATVIFVKQKEHVINNQLLAEFSSSTLQSVNDQIEITQQVLSETAGQIWFKEIEYGNRKGPGSGSLGTYFSSQKLGGIWVLAGKPMMATHPSFAKPLRNTNFSRHFVKSGAPKGFDIFSVWEQAYVRNWGLSRFSDQSVLFDTLLAERGKDTYPYGLLPLRACEAEKQRSKEGPDASCKALLAELNSSASCAKQSRGSDASLALPRFASIISEAAKRRNRRGKTLCYPPNDDSEAKLVKGLGASGLSLHSQKLKGKFLIPLVTIIRGKQKLQKSPSVNIFTKTNILLLTSILANLNLLQNSELHSYLSSSEAIPLAKLNSLLSHRRYASKKRGNVLASHGKGRSFARSSATLVRKVYAKLENKTSSLKNCNTHLVLSNLSKFPKINESFLKRKYLFKYHTYGIQNRLKRYINTHYAKTSTTSIINLQNNYGVLKYKYVLGYSQVTSFKKPAPDSLVTSAPYPEGVSLRYSLLAQLYQRSVGGGFLQNSAFYSEAEKPQGYAKQERPDASYKRSVRGSDASLLRYRKGRNALLPLRLILSRLCDSKKFSFDSKYGAKEEGVSKGSVAATSFVQSRVTRIKASSYQGSIEGIRKAELLAKLRFAQESFYSYGVRGRDKFDALPRQSIEFINNSSNLSNKELNSKENIANYLVMKNNFSVAKKRVSIPLTTKLCEATQFSLAKRRFAGTPVYTFQPDFLDANSIAKPFDKFVTCQRFASATLLRKSFTSAALKGQQRADASLPHTFPRFAALPVKEASGLRAKQRRLAKRRNYSEEVKSLRQDKINPFTNTSEALKGSLLAQRQRGIASLPQICKPLTSIALAGYLCDSKNYNEAVLAQLRRFANLLCFARISDASCVALRRGILASAQEESKGSRIRLTSKAELLAKLRFAQEGSSFATQGVKKQKRACEYRSSKKLDVLPLVSEIDLVTFVTNYGRAKLRSDFVLKNSLEHVISLPPIPSLPPLAPYFNKTSFSFSASLSSFNIPINSFAFQRKATLLTEKRRLQGACIQKKRAYLTYLNQICSVPFIHPFTKGTTGYMTEAFTNFINCTNLQLSTFRVPKPIEALETPALLRTYPASYLLYPFTPLNSSLAKRLRYVRSKEDVKALLDISREVKRNQREGTSYDFTLAEYGLLAKLNSVRRTSKAEKPKGLRSREAEKQEGFFSKAFKSEAKINEPITNNLLTQHLLAQRLCDRKKFSFARSDVHKKLYSSEAEKPSEAELRTYSLLAELRNQRQTFLRSAMNVASLPCGLAKQRSRGVRNSINPLTPSINDRSNNIFPGQLVAYGDNIASNVVTTESGQILYIDSQKTTVRKAQTVLIYSQAIIAVLSGDWIKKGTPLMSLSYQKLVTGDIVQGLPKIEQFFEAPVLRDGTFWSDSLQAKLNQFFQEEREKLPLAEAVRKSFYEIQRVLVEGVLRVYLSQGVLIADKHLEVIVRQMTCKGRILYSGDTGFLRNELVSLDKIENVNQVTYGQKALYHPQVRGITDASLESESFLSAASFQETTRVLSRDAIIGKTDLMRGLKERVIVGELIQAGTGLANNSVYNLLTHSFV